MSRNDDLARYVELSYQIDKLENEKMLLRDAIVQLGSHATQDYVCTVKPQDRRTLSIKDLKTKHPAILANLEDDGTVRIATIFYVSIATKLEKAAA